MSQTSMRSFVQNLFLYIIYFFTGLIACLFAFVLAVNFLNFALSNPQSDVTSPKKEKVTVSTIFKDIVKNLKTVMSEGDFKIKKKNLSSAKKSAQEGISKPSGSAPVNDPAMQAGQGASGPSGSAPVNDPAMQAGQGASEPSGSAPVNDPAMQAGQGASEPSGSAPVNDPARQAGQGASGPSGSAPVNDPARQAGQGASGPSGSAPVNDPARQAGQGASGSSGSAPVNDPAMQAGQGASGPSGSAPVNDPAMQAGQGASGPSGSAPVNDPARQAGQGASGSSGSAPVNDPAMQAGQGASEPSGSAPVNDPARQAGQASEPSGSAQRNVASEINLKIQSYMAPFIYEDVKKRDPFKNPTLQVPKKGIVEDPVVFIPKTPPEKYSLSEIKLKGVIWGTKMPKALFELPSSSGYYTLIAGDRVGQKGVIFAIRESEVVVVETHYVGAGEEKKEKRVIKIKKMDRLGSTGLG